jgi:oligopeptide transport system permease protein
MTTTVQTVPKSGPIDLNAMRKERSLWGDAWTRLSRNRAAVAGLVVIVVFTLLAIFAPLIAPHNPTIQTSNNSLRLPSWVHISDARRTGSPEYFLGTDAIGRDLFSQLVYGTRVSLIVGFIPQVLILLIGVTIGLVAGRAEL